MMNYKQNKFQIWLSIIAILLVVVVFSLYFFKFSDWNFILSSEKGEWGTFGDYIGGVLNPLFSLAALFALLQSIKIQNKQINDTNKEVERQRFETHFFQMLDLFNSVKKEMLIIITHENDEEVNKRYKGIECITKLSNRMFMNFTRLQQNKFNIKNSCDVFYTEHRYFIFHYFRALYSFIKFVDDSNIEKEFYSNIVCVNLSDSEVNLLFYYCYFLDIKENKELLKLVEKYDLLKYFTDPKEHRKLL